MRIQRQHIAINDLGETHKVKVAPTKQDCSGTLNAERAAGKLQGKERDWLFNGEALRRQSPNECVFLKTIQPKREGLWNEGAGETEEEAGWVGKR